MSILTSLCQIPCPHALNISYAFFMQIHICRTWHFPELFNCFPKALEIGSWAGWVRVIVLLDDMYLYNLRQSLGPCMNASFLIPTFQSGTLEAQRDRNVKVLVRGWRESIHTNSVSRRQGWQAAASVVVTESML